MAAEGRAGGALLPGDFLSFPSRRIARSHLNSASPLRFPKLACANLAAAKKEVDVVVVNKLPASRRGLARAPPRKTVGALRVTLVLFLRVCGDSRLKAAACEASQGRAWPGSRALKRRGAGRLGAGGEEAGTRKAASPALCKGNEPGVRVGPFKGGEKGGVAPLAETRCGCAARLRFSQVKPKPVAGRYSRPCPALPDIGADATLLLHDWLEPEGQKIRPLDFPGPLSHIPAFWILGQDRAEKMALARLGSSAQKDFGLQSAFRELAAQERSDPIKEKVGNAFSLERALIANAYTFPGGSQRYCAKGALPGSPWPPPILGSLKCEEEPPGSLCCKRKGSHDRRLSLNPNPLIYQGKLKDSIIIFMIGGPGSGKGVQSIQLSSRYDFYHVAIGDLLREEASRSTSKGKAIRDFLLKGAMVPSGYVLDLLTDKMLKAENSKGFFIEGFPREINQARMFEEIVGRLPNIVIVFDCSTETMIQRLMIRSQLGQRVDDHERIIRQRLETHYTLCEPVLTYYLQKSILRNILGEEPPEVVFAKCCGVVDDVIKAATSTV